MDHLRKRLDPSEKISSVVYGTFEGEILGHNTLKKGVLVATDKHLIFYHRGLLGLSEKMEFFQYKNINAIHFKNSLMGDSVVFRTSGATMQLKWIKEGDGLEFVRVVNNVINK